MDHEEYQRLAYVTANKNLSKEESIINAVMGLCGEAGEVSEVIKKWRFHGHAWDEAKLAKEIGDVEWYLALLYTVTGIDREKVWTDNIAKLKARYPAGHFDSRASINRKE